MSILKLACVVPDGALTPILLWTRPDERSSRKVQPGLTVLGASCWGPVTAGTQTASTVQNQRWPRCPACFLGFFNLGLQSRGIVLPTVRVGLPTSVFPSLEIPWCTCPEVCLLHASVPCRTDHQDELPQSIFVICYNLSTASKGRTLCLISRITFLYRQDLSAFPLCAPVDFLMGFTECPPYHNVDGLQTAVS